MSKIEESVIVKIKERAKTGKKKIRHDYGEGRPNSHRVVDPFTGGTNGRLRLCGKTDTVA